MRISRKQFGSVGFPDVSPQMPARICLTLGSYITINILTIAASAADPWVVNCWHTGWQAISLCGWFHGVRRFFHIFLRVSDIYNASTLTGCALV